MNTVYCPYCGHQLNVAGIVYGQQVKCPRCARSFVNSVEETDAVNMAIEARRKLSAKTRISEWGAVYVGVAIVLVGVLYCLFSYFGSRFQLVQAENKTYRIDKHTGRTSIISPNGKITEVVEPVKVVGRELDFTEVVSVRGWAGPQDDSTSFSGRVYNGNAKTVVTEVTFKLTYTNETGNTSRLYKHKVKVLPLETSSFFFSTVNVGRDFDYSGWCVEACKGYDE